MVSADEPDLLRRPVLGALDPSRLSGGAEGCDEIAGHHCPGAAEELRRRTGVVGGDRHVVQHPVPDFVTVGEVLAQILGVGVLPGVCEEEVEVPLSGPFEHGVGVGEELGVDDEVGVGPSELGEQVGDEVLVAVVEVVQAHHAPGEIGVVGPEQRVRGHVVPDGLLFLLVGMLVVDLHKILPLQPLVHVPAPGALHAVAFGLVAHDVVRRLASDVAAGTHVVEHQVHAQSDVPPTGGHDECLERREAVRFGALVVIGGVQGEQVQGRIGGLRAVHSRHRKKVDHVEPHFLDGVQHLDPLACPAANRGEQGVAADVLHPIGIHMHANQGGAVPDPGGALVERVLDSKAEYAARFGSGGEAVDRSLALEPKGAPGTVHAVQVGVTDHFGHSRRIRELDGEVKGRPEIAPDGVVGQGVE